MDGSRAGEEGRANTPEAQQDQQGQGLPPTPQIAGEGNEQPSQSAPAETEEVQYDEYVGSSDEEENSNYSDDIYEATPPGGTSRNSANHSQAGSRGDNSALWNFSQEPGRQPSDGAGDGSSTAQPTPSNTLQQLSQAVSNASSNPANAPRSSDGNASTGQGNTTNASGLNPVTPNRPISHQSSTFWSSNFNAAPGFGTTESAARDGQGRGPPSDLIFFSPAPPHTSSSLPAADTIPPAGRGVSRFSDVFNNTQAPLSSTPISTSYIDQPRSGFLSNDLATAADNANSTAASPSPQPAPLSRIAAGQSRSQSPFAAVDNIRPGAQGNSPWPPPAVRPSGASTTTPGAARSLPTFSGSPSSRNPAPLSSPSTTTAGNPPPGPASSSSTPNAPVPEAEQGVASVAQQLLAHLQDNSLRLNSLEQTMTRHTATYRSDQAVLLPALDAFARSTADQQTFTRAILTGHEARQSWQRNVDRSLRHIARDASNSSMTMMGVMRQHQQMAGAVENAHEEQNAMARSLQNVARTLNDLQADQHNIFVNMQQFVGSWEVERHVVMTHQEAILSQVSWLEPVAICFQFFGWLLSLFMFWRWGTGGRDGPPHEAARRIPAAPPHRMMPGQPPPPPPGGDQGGMLLPRLGNGIAELFAWFGPGGPGHGPGGEGGGNNAGGGGGGNGAADGAGNDEAGNVGQGGGQGGGQVGGRGNGTVGNGGGGVGGGGNDNSGEGNRAHAGGGDGSGNIAEREGGRGNIGGGGAGQGNHLAGYQPESSQQGALRRAGEAPQNEGPQDEWRRLMAGAGQQGGQGAASQSVGPAGQQVIEPAEQQPRAPEREAGRPLIDLQSLVQPAPGQYGSSIREDGLPYQPYREPSHPEYEPLTPLYSRRFSPNGIEVVEQVVEEVVQQVSQGARARRRRSRDILISFFIISSLLASSYWFLHPYTAILRWPFGDDGAALPSVPLEFVSSSATGHPRLNKPGRGGAWLDEPVMNALFSVQKEAQAISALAALSAESVLACAKVLAEVDAGSTTTTTTTTQQVPKQNWYGRRTPGVESTCKAAVRLGSEVSEKVSRLASRLEWVFGERWWGTVKVDFGQETSVRGSGKMTRSFGFANERPMTTSRAVVAETAGWQWPKRRVPAWM